MAADRTNPVVVATAAGCLVGLVAFLAMGNAGTTVLSAAPVSTSTRVNVAPAVAPQYSQATAQPELVEAEPVEYGEVSDDMVITTPVQAKSWGAIAAGLLAIPFAAGLALLRQKGTQEERKVLVSIDDLVTAGKQAVVASAVVGASAVMAGNASAYPIFAQQAYGNPREPTGRIVCANCHLAAKQTEIELPQAVLPDQVFEAVSKVSYTGSSSVSTPVDASTVAGTIIFQQDQPTQFIQESGIPVSQALVDVQVPSTPNTVFKATIKVPYDQSLKQVGAKGKPADLNVGAVLILPEGFTLAPPERIPEKMKEELNGLQFIKYSEDQPNVLVVGPVPGKLYSEMHVALLSPDPATNKKAEFGSLPVYVGGNRGRGQLYPSGEKSNNNAYAVEHSGKIANIELNEKKRIYTVSIEDASGLVTEVLPPGAELIVKQGDVVEAGQTITTNPNVGGFGQAETEIVLQDPGRVKAFLAFTVIVLANQTILVLKKKQYEKVQLAEMNF